MYGNKYKFQYVTPLSQEIVNTSQYLNYRLLLFRYLWFSKLILHYKYSINTVLWWFPITTEIKSEDYMLPSISDKFIFFLKILLFVYSLERERQ